MTDIKEIINDSLKRTKSGKGSDLDKAIYTLLQHNKKFKKRILELEQYINESGVIKNNIPVHQQKPWYLED